MLAVVSSRTAATLKPIMLPPAIPPVPAVCKQEKMRGCERDSRMAQVCVMQRIASPEILCRVLRSSCMRVLPKKFLVVCFQQHSHSLKSGFHLLLSRPHGNLPFAMKWLGAVFLLVLCLLTRPDEAAGRSGLAAALPSASVMHLLCLQQHGFLQLLHAVILCSSAQHCMAQKPQMHVSHTSLMLAALCKASFAQTTRIPGSVCNAGQKPTQAPAKRPAALAPSKAAAAARASGASGSSLYRINYGCSLVSS